MRGGAAAFNRINTVYIGPCGTRLIMENNVVLFFDSNCWLAGKTFAYNGKTENLAEQHDVPVLDSSLVLVGGAQVIKLAWKFLSIDPVVGKQDSKCQREWPKPPRSEKKKAKSGKKIEVYIAQ